MTIGDMTPQDVHSTKENRLCEAGSKIEIP